MNIKRLQIIDFIVELILLVSLVVCCILKLLLPCVIIVTVSLFFVILSTYINYNILQVVHFCKIKGLLILQGDLEKADSLDKGLTPIQRLLFNIVKGEELCEKV